jgi:hypothetical protein
MHASDVTLSAHIVLRLSNNKVLESVIVHVADGNLKAEFAAILAHRRLDENFPNLNGENGLIAADAPTQPEIQRRSPDIIKWNTSHDVPQPISIQITDGQRIPEHRPGLRFIRHLLR